MKISEQTWKMVTELAREHGASEDQIRKWRERGAVSDRWCLKLIAASKGRLVAGDFLDEEAA